MSDMFDNPGSAVGVDYKELLGRLLLITPHSTEKVNTTYGESDCVRGDLVVLDGPQAGTEYKDTLVFPRVLQSQIRGNAGTGRMNLGRLGQGAAKPGQSPPWRLEDPTDGDKTVARAHLAKNASVPF